MAEGLSWAEVQDAAFIFGRGKEFVRTFDGGTGASLINPMDHPAQFAEAVARLNPRHPMSVFNVPQEGGPTNEYVDRFAQADKSLPTWVIPHEDVIYRAAHLLGIRDAEIGTTFQHDFTPGGVYDIGLALEGGNNASENRARALANAVVDGVITIGKLVIPGTDREVKKEEGHKDPATGEDLTIGHQVAKKVGRIILAAYPETFGEGEGRIPVEVMDIRTHAATTRDVLGEVVLRTGIRSVVMAGSNIYGTWMRTDMATVQHMLNELEVIDFGAGPDDPKAARTLRIWVGEIVQALVAAAKLRQEQLVRKRG